MPSTGKELCRLLETAGWNKLRQKGSHVIFEFPEMNLRETIPMHDELAPGTEHQILKSLKKSLEGREIPKN